MASPQGLAHFGGITSLLSASYTLTHGITPGVATLYVPPQPGMIFRSSPMAFSYGTAYIVFPDCMLDRITVEFDRDGRQVWALHILDRRWKWKFAGRISGYYNVRRGGDEIVVGTEASPRELAKLCFEAMGEKRFDLSKMPDKARPEIEWDYDLPSEALSRLCDSVGCRVILRLDNSVSIEQAGVGRAMPIGGGVLENSVESDPPERPDTLIFAAGRTRFQHDFVLEAVGRDYDNEVKPIDELSYTPVLNSGVKSWTCADVPWMNCISNRKHRAFAIESVFKWYRIKTPIATVGEKKPLTDLDRILPIEDVQVETWKIAGRTEPRPAWVYGKYTSGYEGERPFDPDVQDNLQNYPRSLYSRAFTVDKATAIVKFAEPVYLLDWAVATAGRILPADIRLRTAYSVRDEETRGWHRYEVKRKLPGVKAGTLPRYLIHDDVTLQFYRNYVPPKVGIIDNKAEVEKQAKYYLDAAQLEYQWDSPQSVSYAGFRAINPDGAIQQVTWSISEQGFATTRASRNKEELLIVPSYKERRLIERLQVALQRDAETERQKEAKRQKAQA